MGVEGGGSVRSNENREKKRSEGVTVKERGKESVTERNREV